MSAELLRQITIIAESLKTMTIYLKEIQDILNDMYVNGLRTKSHVEPLKTIHTEDVNK